jgi:hypothetical protein
MAVELVIAALSGPVLAAAGIVFGRKQAKASVEQTKASVEQTLTNASATAVATMTAVLEAAAKARELERNELLNRITLAEETTALSRGHFVKCEADLAAMTKDVELLKLKIKELEETRFSEVQLLQGRVKELESTLNKMLGDAK